MRYALILTTLTSWSSLLAQNCLFYGEFDDPPCFGLCGPAGWSNSGTAYIVDGDTYDSGTYDCSYNVPESPTGGTYQTLWDSNTGTIAGEISTTISGLTPGTEYQFGFWAATPSWICNGIMTGGGIELYVTLDGVQELVPTDIGWGLYEYCVTATSSTIDISFTVQHTGLVGPALIDDAFCSDLSIQCCALSLDADTDLSICPEENLFIDLSYANETGSLNIEWTSDPPSGLAFLDTSDPEQPVFNYNTNIDVFTGTQIIYTATVEDDLCELQIEVVVDVIPYPQVAFDFNGNTFCSNQGEFIFPTSSTDGITGTWDVSSVFLQDHPGELIYVNFTPTDPSVLCPISSEHFIEVQEEVNVSFDFPLVYCRAQNDIVYFPTTTLENIEGTWSPSLLEFDLLTDGIYTISFTPDDPFCIIGLELEIEIYSGDLIEFDLPNLICASDDPYVFPTDNMNGVPGFWEFSSMDLSNASGTLSNTFIANTTDCYENFEYIFEVQDDIELSFSHPTVVCQSDAAITLGAISQEGYEGQWSIPVLDPAFGNSFMSTWSPMPGQSDCLSDTTITINILPASGPAFDIQNTFCSLEPMYTLPTTSNQGITGNWTVPIVDPSTGATNIQSTFNPDPGQCANTFSVDVNIINPDIPEFDLPTQFCSLDDSFILPTLSGNMFEGSWSMGTIDPSLVTGNQLIVTFESTADCVETVEWVFEIEQASTADFTLPEIFCWDGQDLVLPTIDNNGITGTWAEPMIDISSYWGETITNTFTPTDGQCSAAFVESFIILDALNVQFTSEDPSDCNLEDGMIQFAGQTADLEFSIDGGASWQAETSFDQLSSGTYEVLVRFVQANDCISTFQANLNVLGAPDINSIVATDIDGCNEENGTINIFISTNDIIEYSIDGGENWEPTGTFTNLTAGTYEISVRTAASPDCVSNGFATIEPFLETEIINVMSTDITDCMQADGTITIDATGQNIEFSIDGGQSWSTENNYSNLPAGNYDIVVRSTDDIDCTKTESVNLNAPGTPIINLVIGLASSDCFPLSGSIILEVQNAGPNLLYSLDGVDWQEENLFEGLSIGDYLVYVQDINNPNCIAQDQVTVNQNEDALPLATYSKVDPTACNLSDGSIGISINETDLEFSNDGGVTWQEESTFENLPAGNYLILIRKIDAPDCTSEFFVTLNEPDCPCNDLVVDLQALNIDCTSNDTPIVQLASAEGMIDNNFTIQWDTGETGEEIMVSDDGWYGVTIFYDEECEWTDSIYVELVEDITFDYQTTNSDCPEASNGSIYISNVSGGSGNYDIALTNGFEPVEDSQNVSAGVYQIEISDDSGCVQVADIEVFANEEITLGIDEIISYNLGDTLILDPAISAAEIDSFSWTPNEGILNPGELIAEVSPFGNVEYELQIFYGSCFTSQVFLLDLDQITNVFVPNIIDTESQTNNKLFPQGSDYIEIIEFSVYDRWGELIYSASQPSINDPSQGWDGRFNGLKVNPGVFVYYLEYDGGDNETEKQVGTVTVF